MSDVKWIKIVTDIFDDEKIKYIETLPNGDTTIVIWFRLLCLAGKSNTNGFLMMTDRIAYTDEMLSSIFKRDIKVIQLALSIFKNLGMVEIVDNAFYLTNWELHQNAEKLAKIKEQTRIRVAKHRENARIGNANSVTEALHDSYSNATDNISSSYSDESSSISSLKDNKYKDIIDYLNEKSKKHFRVVTQTKKLIDVRLKEGFLIDDFYRVIDNQCDKWLSDPKMNDYLRPQTLFGTKFESYLNTTKTKKFDIMDL